MSKYESLKEYRNLSAETRLGMLAMEMVRHLAVIHGLGSIIEDRLEDENIGSIEELRDWMRQIVEAADDLAELREILVLSAHRD